MITNDPTHFGQYRVSIAAEAIAAAQLARAGYDVSVQYGANQPLYDVIAVKGDRILQISVKGSKDGGWGLTQGYKRDSKTYHDAADEWLQKHGENLVFVLVQFEKVSLDEMPRTYVARAKEIAEHLKNARNGRGDTTLVEDHTPSRGVAANYRKMVPLEWKFTQDRIDKV
jgi:Holliday junction resolvase-like predicted endonuclease